MLGESCALSFETNACSSSYEKEAGDTVVVCGSRNEVGNGLNRESIFNFAGSPEPKFNTQYANQKRNVWSMIALGSPDQLRQRVAWALSQIFAISPSQVRI